MVDGKWMLERRVCGWTDPSQWCRARLCTVTSYMIADTEVRARVHVAQMIFRCPVNLLARMHNTGTRTIIQYNAIQVLVSLAVSNRRYRKVRSIQFRNFRTLSNRLHCKYLNKGDHRSQAAGAPPPRRRRVAAAKKENASECQDAATTTKVPPLAQLRCYRELPPARVPRLVASPHPQRRRRLQTTLPALPDTPLSSFTSRR